MFKLKILDLHWIRNDDGVNDLCAHGHVEVRIGNEIISDFESGDWTLSSSALSLLRTTKNNYAKGENSNQLLPCCGHTIFASDDGNSVSIIGCGNGIDWEVQHLDNEIKITSENGNEALIDLKTYKDIIFEFADEVENFYKNSKPKIIPEDESDKKGYHTFWKEWKYLREEKNCS